MATGYLAELDSVARPRNWAGQSTIFADSLTVFADSTSITPASSTGTYVAQLSARTFLVTVVTEDGVALIERASPALVSANAGSWYWDGAVHRLWVRTTDDTPALGKRILVTITDTFRLGDGPSVYLRNGVPVAYEGRIAALPAVSLSLQADSNDPVLGAVVSLGELELYAHDGLLEEWQGERMLAGRDVRHYRGELGDPRAPTGANVEDLDLWLAALTDSLTVTPESARFTLMSRARALNVPALPSTFAVATYPAMDPEIEGIKIPRLYGRAVKAECFRIGVGRWKVAAHAIGDVFAAVTATDDVVPLLTLDLALGEFTVDVAYDGETRLYADGDGTVGGALGPGGLIRALVTSMTDFTDDDLDLGALAALDVARPVRIGFQVTDQTVREALDRVARSAFADWFLTRQGLISARARARGGVNLITNPHFETDLAGWRPLVPALSSLARVAAGPSAPAGDWMAEMKGTTPGAGWLAGAWLQTVPGQSLSVTALVSATPTSTVPQTPSAFRWEFTDVDEAAFLAQSEPVSVPFGVWTRSHWHVDGAALAVLHAATAASTDIFADDATFDITSGLAADVAGNLDLWVAGDTPVAGTPLGPESGIYMTDVRVTPSIRADDTNAQVTAITPEPLVLWEVSVPCRVDGRTRTGPLATAQDTAARDLYPLAESRAIDADCADMDSAQLVADAYLDWYSHARARTTMRLYDWTQPLEPGHVIDCLHLSRTLQPPLSSHLYTVVSVREAAPSNDAPTIEVDAILHFDPAVGPLVRF